MISAKRILYCFLLVLLVFSCKQKEESTALPSSKASALELKYAKGFEVQYGDAFNVLQVHNPWQGADRSFKYVLIEKEKLAVTTFEKDTYDGIITLPINSLVATSTTHIPFLELLGVETALTGFPGCDYISSENTRKRIDDGSIKELGTNEGINTEVLLALRPELIITFGVDGGNKSLEVAQNAGIPILYNGDWMEPSALAKAEWIKFFSVLFNKEKEATTIFEQIEKDYNAAKELASNATSSPSILAGAMHKDIWYLPNGKSPEAQFLKDANTNYLWKDTDGNGSLSLSIEEVLVKAKDADFWISPSYYTSYEALNEASNHYKQFSAFKNKNVYTFSKTTGATGGVLYYELGIARPDLVLKDIIKICHPTLLNEYTTTFFKPL